jgi:hypothetical protein
MIGSAGPAVSVREFMEAIAGDDDALPLRLLDAMPSLATQELPDGATRQNPTQHYLATLGRYLYEGDTPLHVAAAAWRPEMLRRLVAAGANARSSNRRGATPLHYAASGNPDSARWRPTEQCEAISALIDAGADPNAADKNGSTPLHKAIRTRCAAATEALLARGADPTIRTRNGTTLHRLASVSSGRGGSGSPRAREQQSQILRLLEQLSPQGPGP